MKRVEVKSSNIKSVGYDPKTKTLEVEFTKGQVYTYAGVPPKVHVSLIKSESIGRAFATLIRGGGYKFAPVDPKTQHSQYCSKGIGPVEECHICGPKAKVNFPEAKSGFGTVTHVVSAAGLHKVEKDGKLTALVTPTKVIKGKKLKAHRLVRVPRKA